ncbi:MAG TPA: exodeoxyribonuclease VII large subunit [Chloroflexota bacterium]|nr:exodeoxyribonuclease VII large subunit [Chloroflexota bacterium]
MQRVSAGVLGVSEVTAQIKSLLEDDPTLSDCWVRGEVSDPRTYGSGHTYFTLKDSDSQLKCVLFKQRARGLEPLQNGRLYAVRGAISVYESRGEYQLYVTDHRPIGVGELYQQFELLKAKLEAEGLFSPERKRPLPAWPRRIGIATSKQGAVLHDLQQVIGRRYPLAELLLAPCQVQGADAVRSIVRSLRALSAKQVDVIVLARGGGSAEDLWAFNDEAVARAIAASAAPVVSAVGHETDFTIADFVADVRAATPSVAGELVVPDSTELNRQVAELALRARRALEAQLWSDQTNVLDATHRLQRALAGRLERTESRLAALSGRLEALSPLAVLGRGYAVVRDAESGAVLRSSAAAHVGQRLDVRLAQGELTAQVSAVAPPTRVAEALTRG